MRTTFILCGVLASAAQIQAATATPPTATATPAALTFTYQSGSTTQPTAQTVAVKASAGTPSFTTSIVPVNPSSALWLIVGPDSGNIPASLSVRANATGLMVGSYTATVVVTVTGVTNPVNISVTLNVTTPPPSLTAAPTTLNFTYPSSALSQTVTLSTNGASIQFTATSGSAWATVSPAIGVVLPGDPVTLTVAVSATSLTPQASPYAGKITLTLSGAASKSQNITVNFTVNSSAPTITSVFPSTLQVNSGDSTVNISGTNFYSASASNQTVAKIQGVTAALKTTVISSTALQAVIPAASLLSAGSLSIIVENPAPGGDSAAQTITVASTPTIASVVNAASYATGALSPGELVAILGTNIGPAQPVPMSISSGYVQPSVGGVSVTIDGKAAPIIYAGANQVNVQVPYEVTAGTNKAVSVTSGSNPAATTTVTIAATAPGIFTDLTGIQVIAMNYSATTNAEYGFNGAANPAKIGDTIVFYLTGEGDYNSSPLDPNGTSNTGYIVSSSSSQLPQINPLPSVTIGGVNATVSYAGPVVGSILGLLQMNVVVPTGSTTGAAVPLVITFGSNNTQNGVMLAIHP